MRLFYTLIFILLSIETYSQKRVIFGEVFSDEFPFTGYLFSDHGDSVKILDGTFSLSLDKTKIFEKVTICFKRHWIGKFSIINIPLAKDSLYLGKIIIPPMLTYNETQMDSIRQNIKESIIDSSMIEKIINDNYLNFLVIRSSDPPRQPDRHQIKREPYLKTTRNEYWSKYIFARPYIPCPLDLSKKIVINYYESDKTGYVDYHNLKVCGKKSR